MENILQHIYSKPILAVIFVAALFIVLSAIPYFTRNKKLYGSMFEFASTTRKVSAGVATLALVVIGIYATTPYVEPPSNQIAIVLGNTQNTPAPSITGNVSDAIVATMLKHKGADVDEIIESIKIISAVKQPEVVDLDASDMELRSIGHNNSNAKRDAKLNIEAIEAKIDDLNPADNGANYLEAIFEARNNVESGSSIIVIGSGLSDSGDMNFSKTGILTSEDVRDGAIKDIQDKYGSDYLDGYNIEFYGLGDTVDPQEALSSIQKDVVRNVYEEVIRKLGGKPDVHTATQTGPSVTTKYVVGTTDTGCGDIKLVFDDDDLKFVGDHAVFIDEAAAVKSLSMIRDVWVEQSDTIEKIQIDGYTAHYPGADKLSQERADTVKKTLVGLGISSEKINANGRGYGPYETDIQNRTVKVNISRDNKQCNV